MNDDKALNQNQNFTERFIYIAIGGIGGFLMYMNLEPSLKSLLTTTVGLILYSYAFFKVGEKQ